MFKKKKKHIKPTKPTYEKLTLNKIDELLDDRVEFIGAEFKKGFNFIKNHNRSVTFFGSARTPEGSDEYEATRNLAKRISQELGYAVVTGGALGAMEAANRGAYEVGGESLGLNIELPFEQAANKYLTDYMEFHYFFSRKVCLSFSAEAYVFVPGGFGTMDELFEILTLVQTEKIERVPIILFGSKFWNGLDKFIKNSLLKNQKISPEDIDLYTITDDEDAVLEMIKKAPVRTILSDHTNGHIHDHKV